jgi:C1A family cysteine protease
MNMAISRRRRALGWRRQLPDPRDHKFSVGRELLQSLPPSIDLTPSFPVYDQGRSGSCTANALAAAVQFDRTNSGEAPDFVPSRLFIYYNERVIESDVPLDAGANLRDGVKSLQQQGVCPEQDWTYDDTPGNPEGGPFPVGSKPATLPSQNCYNDAANYTITSYQALAQSLSQLQGCLASGFPFVFGFSVFASWYYANPAATIMPMPSGDDTVVGGHAVLCVGYDNGTNLFKFRNSWGPDVGDGGYFYMPYAYMIDPNYASDFWVINSVSN